MNQGVGVAMTDWSGVVMKSCRNVFLVVLGGLVCVGVIGLGCETRRLGTCEVLVMRGDVRDWLCWAGVSGCR